MVNEFTTSMYHEFERRDFTFAGRTATVIFPKEPREDGAWIWRAEFLGVFDAVDVELLRRGWHLVGYGISDMYGSPASVRLMKDFYDFVVPAFHLSPKCDLFGFSRGGLYSFNFTCAHPECVSVLYLDAPVMDMRDWPCGERYAGTFDYEECPKQYGMTREEILASENLHPVDRVGELLAAKTPLLMIAGARDSVVIWEKNGKRITDALKASGHELLEIIKPECDHHPHSLEDPGAAADFIEKHR